MDRRAIVALLTGALFYPRFASASSPTSRKAAVTAPRSGAETKGGVDRRLARTRVPFPDLKRLGTDHQVRSIAYSRGTYSVETTNGTRTAFLESDLRFKIDSSEFGPRKGQPIILPSGTEGDRARVIFAAPQEIGRFIKHSLLCDQDKAPYCRPVA
jgi:hypothetical protein